MKKCIAVTAAMCLMLGSFSGCTKEQDEIDKALGALGAAVSDAGEAVGGAVDAAKSSVNYLGEAMGINGEYGSTMEMLSAYADDFKSKVTNKLEELDCGEYVPMLESAIDDISNIQNSISDAWQETNVTETATYKFFQSFNMSQYDVTFTVYTHTDTFNRCRVIKDETNGNLNTYSSMYIFNKAAARESGEVFDLLGLLYSSAQDNVWYDCNQVSKTKTVSKMSSEYKAWEAILAGYSQGTFKSSTLNNLINDRSDISVDRFSDGTKDVMFIFKEGKLFGVIYTVGEHTDYAWVTVNDFNEDSIRLINAGVEYKLKD